MVRQRSICGHRERISLILRHWIGFLFISCLLVMATVHGQENVAGVVDSLVRVTRTGERAILVSFGADAITGIKTKEGIVVIDAGISTRLTSRYREIIENEFQSTRFRYVIYTHGHHDHTRGSRVFGDAEIIAHVNSVGEIQRQNENRFRAAANLKRVAGEYSRQLTECENRSDEWKENFTQQYRCLSAAGDIEDSITIREPDRVFTDSLVVHLDDITLEMYFFGRCHSASDILVHVPELKLLFTGDLFTRYGRPSVNDDLELQRERWKESAIWLENRSETSATVITGHGQVLGPKDLGSFLQAIKTY